MALSTTSEGMTKSAQIMQSTEAAIQKIMVQVDSEVHGMPYQSASATKFRDAVNQWQLRAATIVRDLDNIAAKLSAGASSISSTEDQNSGLAAFQVPTS